jgi:hypothetical protein
MAFESITKGPSGPTSSNLALTPNGLGLDQQNNVVVSVGSAGTEQALQTALLVLQAQTALTAITTAQNLISQALNAGFLNRKNRTLQITVFGIYTTPAGTPTLTFAVTLGGVTLCSITTAATAGSGTNIPFQLSFTISTAATGSSGTIESHGSVSAGITATATAAVAEYVDTNVAVSSAVNLTTALTLLVTIAASSTVTSAQLRLATIEVTS